MIVSPQRPILLSAALKQNISLCFSNKKVENKEDAQGNKEGAHAQSSHFTNSRFVLIEGDSGIIG